MFMCACVHVCMYIHVYDMYTYSHMTDICVMILQCVCDDGYIKLGIYIYIYIYIYICSCVYVCM